RLRHFGKPVSIDLSHLISGQAIHCEKTHGYVGADKLALAVRTQLLFIDGVYSNNRRPRLFDPQAIRSAKNSGVDDTRESREDLFDALGVHLGASEVQNVLLATGNNQELVRGERGDVSRVKPTLAERSRGFEGIAHVGANRVFAGDAQYSFPARRQETAT